MPTQNRLQPVRVLIVGGGFGGRYAAQRLALRLPTGSTVTVIDRQPYLLYTPMLTEVVAGAVRSEHICAASGSLRKVSFKQAEVTQVNLHTKAVRLATGETLEADHLVVALGSTTNFRGVPGAEEHSIAMKTLGDAESLRARVVDSLQAARAAQSPGERRRLLTFVVAGGGYTGVETMAALRELLYRKAPSFGIRSEEIRLLLIEPGDRLMAEMPEALGEYGQHILQEDGVEVIMGASVEAVANDSLELSDGRQVAYGVLLWDAGIMPSPFLKQLDCPLGKHGGIVTDSCFQVQDVPGVWAIGDCAETPNPKQPGKTFAPTAQNATRAGVHVADNINHVLRGRRPKPFEFQQIGTLALVSDRQGVAHVFGAEIKGALAWLMWRAIYIAKMPETAKKLALLSDYSSRAGESRPPR